jgi:hypothetical protein
MKTPEITSGKFRKSDIAPCGMNCGTCIARLREKNKCNGCRTLQPDAAKTRLKCSIRNCVELRESTSGFCYDCKSFPCKRIRNIDKRYRTKYHTSFIENLRMIEERGIDVFLAFETMRRTCPECNSVLSVHRDHCLSCNEEIRYREE